MGQHALFEIVTDIPPLPLVIRDTGHPHDKHLTITNDVEDVVQRVAPLLTAGRRLLYIDSLGDTCEIVVKDGAFADFKSIREEPSESFSLEATEAQVVELALAALRDVCSDRDLPGKFRKAFIRRLDEGTTGLLS